MRAEARQSYNSKIGFSLICTECNHNWYKYHFLTQEKFIVLPYKMAVNPQGAHMLVVTAGVKLLLIFLFRIRA